ncbi:MAG: hypothetical protein J7L16_07450 [Deltaproteobacteria bacterium]|nr:hypothetical protein [Deltaproteobacteria bacterium]
MSEGQEINVSSARDALSLLSQKMYSKFGADALPEIEYVWHKLGLAVGEKMKKNLPDTNLSTVARSFTDGARKRGTKIDLIKLDDKVYHLKSYACALGLKGKGRDLCAAAMGCDRGIFESATEMPVKLSIIQTLADGDECCEVIFEV